MSNRFINNAVAIELLAAAWLVGTAATANAQSVMHSEVSGYQVIRKGEASATDLAASEANRQALQQLPQKVPAKEQPKHRLPNGGLTSIPSPEMLRALPQLDKTNVSVAAGADFSSLKGFTGIYEGDNVTVNRGELEPPDQGLAVHNNVAAELNNNIVQFFNASTGAALTGPIANSAFFGTGTNSLSDTQVFYDLGVNRWFIIELTWNSSFYGFAVAVSQTNNPRGSYWLYQVRAFSNTVGGCQAVDCFPDYPKGGYDANAFYITADLFSNVSGNFVESAIYAMPKSKLINGQGFTYIRFDDASDFVVQPSVPAPGEPFSTADNGSEFFLSAPGSSTLSILAIINSNNIVSNIGSMAGFRNTLSTENHGGGTVPSPEPRLPVGPYCLSVGYVASPYLDGGYSAFQATIQKASGKLYGALPFGAADGNGLNRDVLAWFEVAPSLTSSSVSGSVVTQGYVVPPNGYSLIYPAFGLNKTGAGALGMTITNPTEFSAAALYPSAAVLEFTGTAPTGAIFVTGQGSTSDDGFTGCPLGGRRGVGRWGDYGAATVDSVTGYFYAANEMIPNPSVYPRGTFANWGTFITQAKTSAWGSSQ